jgi:hypothetical protein
VFILQIIESQFGGDATLNFDYTLGAYSNLALALHAQLEACEKRWKRVQLIDPTTILAVDETTGYLPLLSSWF